MQKKKSQKYHSINDRPPQENFCGNPALCAPVKLTQKSAMILDPRYNNEIKGVSEFRNSNIF